MVPQENLAELEDRALAMGATRARLFSARDVVVDERARLKCLVPRCINYGKPMCPPSVMSVDDFRRILARYEHALLVQKDFELTPKKRAGLEDGQTLAQLVETQGHLAGMASSLRDFYNLIGRVEAEAFRLGYRFAAGFGFGNYREALEKDENGKYREPPFTARPSMEAMGIDVFETARRAGLPISFAKDSAPCYTGLILVD